MQAYKSTPLSLLPPGLLNHLVRPEEERWGNLSDRVSPDIVGKWWPSLAEQHSEWDAQPPGREPRVCWSSLLRPSISNYAKTNEFCGEVRLLSD
jgi:hypothetical protein